MGGGDQGESEGGSGRLGEQVEGPPRFDLSYLARAGDVEARPLDQYEGIAR